MEALSSIAVQVIVVGIIGGQAVGVALKQAAMGQLLKISPVRSAVLGGGAILGSLFSGATGADPARRGAAGGALGGLLGDAVGGVGGGAILTAIAWRHLWVR